MNKTIFIYVFATIFTLATTQTLEHFGKNDAKKQLVKYISGLSGTSQEDLNKKDLEELFDVVFANIKEHLEKGTNPKKFETDLKWFQRIRDSLPPTPNIAHSVQSEEDFNERVKNAGSKVVLIDFHAKWCKPCHLLSPYIEQFAKKYESQLLVLKVDVDDETELALHRYRASKLPTFVYLKNGAEVERYFGTDYRHIESVIKKFI